MNAKVPLHVVLQDAEREEELARSRDAEQEERDGRDAAAGALEPVSAAVDVSASGRVRWLLDAADLLAEPDPGPTAWLIDGLIVDRSLVAAVGRWKTTKSYGLLDLCIAIATGRPAFGKLTVPEPGPVVFVNEESGRAALWRRLDALCRGRAIDPEELRGRLFVAANANVRLDDAGWQTELADIGRELRPRLVCFDPLARMKAAAREENSQSDMAVLIEFVRWLREETGAAVAFVHHTGHTGEHMRGASDLESAWETRLAWKRDGQSPEVTITSEHREAESSGTIKYRIDWDGLTRSMRFDLVEDDLIGRVRAYLNEHPEASANEVNDNIEGKRAELLAAVKKVRDEGGSQTGNHPGTTPLWAPPAGGSPALLFRGLGTTPAEPGSQLREPPPADDLGTASLSELRRRHETGEL
jgi:hypothetical protein